jgi:pimeloyl-ACP methyl ester carboxylesterase
MPSETWFLLRGLTREAAHWGAFAPQLSDGLGDAEVVPLDLPGAGARLGDRWPARVGEAMEMVRADALARAPTGRRFVLGVSLGGMVTMEWAARYPGELAGVVIGASSARDVAPFWKRMRPGALRSVVLGSFVADVARREHQVVRTICNRDDLWAETSAAWTEIQRARPVSRATARAQLASAVRWRAPARLDVPALFLVGQGDRLVHPDCSRALARRFGAPLAEHPTAGHDLTTDAADWALDRVIRWRRDLGASTTDRAAARG